MLEIGFALYLLRKKMGSCLQSHMRSRASLTNLLWQTNDDNFTHGTSRQNSFRINGFSLGFL